MPRLVQGSVLQSRYTVGADRAQEYSFQFTTAEGADVLVTIDGAPLSFRQFSVSPGRFSGGLVTVAEPPPAGATLVIERQTIAARRTGFGDVGFAPAVAVEAAVSNLLRMIEELTYDYERSAQAPGHGLSSIRIDGNQLVFVRDDGAELPVTVPAPGGGVLFTADLQARYGAAATYLDERLKGVALAESYEAIADRNRFSDFQRAKLASVEADAEKNRPELTPAQVAALYEAYSDRAAFTIALRDQLGRLVEQEGVTQQDVDTTVTLLAGAAGAQLRHALLALVMQETVLETVMVPGARGSSNRSGTVLEAGSIVGWRVDNNDPIVLEADRILALAPTDEGNPLAAAGIRIGITLNGLSSGVVLTVGRTPDNVALIEFDTEADYEVQPTLITGRAAVPSVAIDARMKSWAQIASTERLPFSVLPIQLADAQTSAQVITTINQRLAELNLAGITWGTLSGRPGWVSSFDGSYPSLTGQPDIPTDADVDTRAKAQADAEIASKVESFALNATTLGTQQQRLAAILGEYTPDGGWLNLAGLKGGLTIRTTDVRSASDFPAAVVGTLDFAIVKTAFGTYALNAFLVRTGSTWTDTGLSVATDRDTNLDFSRRLINEIRLRCSTGTGVTFPAATALLAGLMAGTDKARLDAITDALYRNVPQEKSSWTETDSTDPKYIDDKPDLVGAAYRFLEVAPGQHNPGTALIPFTVAQARSSRIIHVGGAFTFGTDASFAFMGIPDVGEATWFVVYNTTNRRIILTAPDGNVASTITVQVGQARLVARAGRELVSFFRWPVNWSQIAGRPGSFPPSGHRHPWGQIDGRPNLALYARLASPAFTGNPTAPTPARPD